MFKFEKEYIVTRDESIDKDRFGICHIDSAVKWHKQSDGGAMKVMPSEIYPPHVWAALGFCAIVRDDGGSLARYLPYRLLDCFLKLCGSPDFGDKMPLYINLMRCVVACHKDCADLPVSKGEAQGILDKYNAALDAMAVKEC